MTQGQFETSGELTTQLKIKLNATESQILLKTYPSLQRYTTCIGKAY